MRPGRAGFRQSLTDAAVKHMIIISDGDPSAPGSGVDRPAEGHGRDDLDRGRRGARPGREQTAGQTSPVGRRQVLRGEQSQGPAADLPARGPPRGPAAGLRERDRPRLQQKSLHEMLSGIDPLPPITGFVLTSKKENPLVEVGPGLAPAGRRGEQHGAGRLDLRAGPRRGLHQRRRHPLDQGTGPARRSTTSSSARSSAGRCGPAAASGKFTTAFEPHDGQMRVVVTALDKNDQFLNFLTMTGTAVGPDLKKPLPLTIEQTAPGRYVGTFPVRDAGSYFVTINPGRSMAPIRTGVNVPYSRRVPRPRSQRRPARASLPPRCPRTARPGRLIEDRQAAPTPSSRCWPSTRSATTWPGPPAARTSGTGCCCWQVACSWPTCSCAGCTCISPGCRRWPHGCAIGCCAGSRRRRSRSTSSGCGAARRR